MAGAEVSATCVTFVIAGTHEKPVIRIGPGTDQRPSATGQIPATRPRSPGRRNRLGGKTGFGGAVWQASTAQSPGGMNGLCLRDHSRARSQAGLPGTGRCRRHAVPGSAFAASARFQ